MNEICCCVADVDQAFPIGLVSKGRIALLGDVYMANYLIVAEKPGSRNSSAICVYLQPVVIGVAIGKHSDVVAIEVNPMCLQDFAVVLVQIVFAVRVSIKVKDEKSKTERPASCPPIR